MTVYFFDSSALVKRYVTETGTTWVRSITLSSANNVIFIAQIAPVETVSAFSRRIRDGSMKPRTAQAARQFLNRHTAREYEVINLGDSIIRRAQDLLERHTLRGLDAIQLASAVEINSRLVTAYRPPLIFVCADIRLLNVAAAEGLPTHLPQ